MQTGEIYSRTFDESSGKQSANGCPECGGRVDTNAHETVCEACGLVLAEQSIDRGPEWRSFPDDGDTGGESKRTGAPLTPTRHDDGLSTDIGRKTDGVGNELSGSKRQRMARLRRQHRRTSVGGKTERNQIQGLYEINRMASAIGLPGSVEERGCVLFKSAQDAGLLPGRSIEAMATASLYAACRCSDTARLLRDFLAVARVNRSSIKNAYNALNRELGLPTPPPSPESFIPQVVSELDLGPDVQRRARGILDVAEAEGISNGRNPAGIAGASLLVAAAQVPTAAKPTQQTVADVVDVSPVTLRAHRDELLDSLSASAPI